MHRRLVILVVIVALSSGCSESPSELDDLGLPNSFDKSLYLAARFDGLESYCSLLEYLYASPTSDPRVVLEIEQLIAKKILLVRIVSPEDLNEDAVSGLLAVLSVAENQQFGNALNRPLILNPSIEHLRKAQTELIARQSYLRSHRSVD